MAPKAVQASLKAIWRGFKRYHYRHPSIYHDLWEPQSPIEQAFPDIWKPVSMIIGGTSVVVADVPDVNGIGDSFRKANNNFDLPHAWKHWHEPSGARYFGCFYGDNGKVWDDFKRLAESAYLVLRQLQPELPDDSFHGWMSVLHQMAHWYPTPLLRSYHRVWRFWDCTSDEDHERWVKPDGGTPYPQHPIQRTLEHDVVTSSMAAIEMILDDERALLVGRRLSDFPISYPGRDEVALQEAIDACRERSTAAGRESGVKGPILLFELRGREWHFEYDTGYGVLKKKYYIKGKPFVGIEVCRYLVSDANADRKKHWSDVLKETGQADKMAGAISKSNQLVGDQESIISFEVDQARLWRQFDDTEDVDKKRAIWEKIDDIDKAMRNAQRKRTFTDDDNKYATQIQAQIGRAIDEIHKVCEELADHLRERVIRRGCCFIYARDDYILRLLTTGVPDIF
jgi:hypothetical protein